jgi:phosphomannomutase
MKLLKLSISGVRGIVGETITPELVINFASAFGTMLAAGPVLVGRDTRKSGPMIQEAATAALLSTGHEVIDLGICPTPIIQYLVKKNRARGAVSITADHNSADWNALNFINSDGTYLNEFQGSELLDIYHLNRYTQKSLKKAPRLIHEIDPEKFYFAWLKNKSNLEEISRARFKVVVDPGNGAGSKLIDKFFEMLGCELVAVNNEGNGYFPHDLEPRSRNAGEVASLVKATGSNIGFLLNSDVSRVSLVTEEGETLSELAQSFPKYYMIKDKLSCPSELAFRAVLELRHRYEKETISTLNGLKIIREDSWVHLRPSNTEPTIRLMAESKSATRSRKIIDNFKKEVREVIRKLS